MTESAALKLPFANRFLKNATALCMFSFCKRSTMHFAIADPWSPCFASLQVLVLPFSSSVV
jgi:hypothetical protein